MKLLIAYNNDSSDKTCSFFSFCGEEMEMETDMRGMDRMVLRPPFLTNGKLLEVLSSCQACFIANHGDAQSIAGSDGDLISINTDNSLFRGKLFYAISCSCAKKLKDALIALGLRSFWGYDNELKIWSGYPQYARSCLAGMMSLMDGKTVKEAREDMLARYDADIAELEALYPDNLFLSAILLDNRESLIVYGEDELRLADLE